MCTVLTFAMCADPNVAGAMSFGDLTVPIVWSRVQLRSCLDVGGESAGGEAGFAHIETAWSAKDAQTDGSTYSGRIVVHIQSARIELTAYSWPHESQADIDALRRLNQATLWHEIGHLRTAKKTVDALNERGALSAPTGEAYTALVNERGNADAARIGADQEEYDRLAEHGLRQETLAPPLAGPDTIIQCPER